MSIIIIIIFIISGALSGHTKCWKMRAMGTGHGRSGDLSMPWRYHNEAKRGSRREATRHAKVDARKRIVAGRGPSVLLTRLGGGPVEEIEAWPRGHGRGDDDFLYVIIGQGRAAQSPSHDWVDRSVCLAHPSVLMFAFCYFFPIPLFTLAVVAPSLPVVTQILLVSYPFLLLSIFCGGGYQRAFLVSWPFEI